MHDPLEALTFGDGGSRCSSVWAATETMVLTSDFSATSLTGPVAPETRAPDFFLGPEVAAH
eukprot:4081683-Pyramimonas_sp.AAC.1